MIVRYMVFACILLGSLACGTGCRDDSNAAKPRVEDLQFAVPKINMKIGERQAVKVNIKPAEARKYHKVKYAASVDGYVSIGDTSNDGCVLTAEKRGIVVIVAKADGYTAYLEVNIDGEEILQVPYIMVPAQVIEVFEGARKTAQVSLYNGSAIDQQQFKWEVETGKDNISINPAGNTVVVQGEKRGSQKIIVSHEKSEFTAEILVFVLGVNEQVRYITSGKNVITMTAGGPSHELVATLVGGKATDISGFTFNIMEENPCIEILPSNNSCSITANRKGTAVIKITHPLAEYPLEARVIVSQSEESYIELDKTFMMLDIGKGDFINAKMGGYYLQNWNAGFTYKLKGDVDCIEINQTNFSFYVTARSAGRCVVEIGNANIQYGREVLVVVRDPNTVTPDEYYITTSQNVLQLEAGKETAVQLSIQLINGIEADKAGFEWTVEDGRVITVEPLDLPNGKNVQYITRSMKNRAAAEIKSVANTLALVTPKKTGSTKITVTHPKSRSTATVICKVYPPGTFGDMLYILGRQEGSLIKIDTTVQQQTGKDTPVKLYMAQGDPLSVGKLTWELRGRSTDAPEIVATVQDLSGLENEIHGTGRGVNKLVVNNENTLKYPFEAVVMVGSTEELAAMAVLYVDQVYQTVAVGQSISVPVLNSSMVDNKPNALSENDQYYVENYDKRLLAATMIKNRLLLQGLSDGSTAVTVKNRTSTEITPVEIRVTVAPGLTTIDRPYMLTGPNFIGMNWGDTNVELKVKLSGDTMDSSAVEKDRVRWSSSNGAMVKVLGNGEIGMLTAGNGAMPSNPAEMTGQANITASHDKSVNDKVVVAYVVPPGVDPLKAVVLGIAQDHWLLKQDDEVMIRLLTNADETVDRDINKIKWLDKNGIDYKTGGFDPVIEVDYSGPAAMVRAKAGGSTVITVTHPAKVIDLKIYVSVSDAPQLAKNITLPSIVELIIDENKVITALADGLSPAELNNIEWSLDDPGVAGISGEQPLGSDGKAKGGRLFIKGKACGQAWLTASQGDLGFVKKILVVCARTYDELANTYVMACEESYFRLKKGDVRAISLVYGSAGFPETQKAFITWEDLDKNNVIKIHPPMNDHAEIEAINEGIARVRISHELIFKPVDLTFEVSKELSPGQSYQFVYNGMMGLVVWKGAQGDPAQYKEPYTKTASLSINPPGLSYNGIEWADEEKPDKNIVKVSAGGMGNEYLITGNAKGQTYIRFSHKSKQIPDDARILVYTAETLAELQQMFPIGVSKQNYLLTIGDPAEVIKITVPQQSALGLSNAEYRAKLDKISWDYGSNGNNILSYTININDGDMGKYKQEVTIQGKNAGNCYFDLKYEGKVVERIYISVKARLTAEMDRRIVTENIIGLLPNTINRKTSVGCNLSIEEKNELEWRTLNPAVVDIQVVPGDKTSCYLNAKGSGETEVVVSFRQIERFIKVYVDANPDQYRAVNLDNRYYRLRRNDTLSLTAFHAALPAAGNDQWQFYPVSSPFDNKVVEIKPDGKDKVDIVGINEGIATIVLYNDECKTDVTFMAEVSNAAPLVEAVTDDWYMTALKTVYALDPAKTMDVTRVSVGGIRFTSAELAKIEWTVVSEETGGVAHKLSDEPGYKPVLLTFNNRRGEFVDIMPNNKTGTAVIRASHPRSVNDVDITVICDAQAVLANPAPHITADRETVKLQLNEEADITVSIQELYEGYDIAQFKAESDNPQRVAVETTGNRIKVKGVNFGQALVTVTHPKLEGYAKKIIVIVMAGDTSLVYLTTKQNFVVLEKGGYQAVEVELAGYSDVNSRNYIWNTDDHDIISISDSGKSAVITAKNTAKTAKITVQHIACIEYPLFIYVRVTEKNTGNPVYITTPNNIAAIKEGAGIQVKANLVNGGGHELSQFSWSTNDRNLIELNYSGDTAMVKGLMPGTARIQIWHPSSLNSITMLVVVEPLEPNNGIYIATDSQLIEMTTAESQRLIRVRLVGGTPEDVYGFQWQISSFSSVLKQGQGQSYQPVSLLANADTCYVQPVQGKYEGEAIITISHPKTNYKLDIKVIIADATDIKFAQSYITMNQYEQAIVNLTAPSNGALNLNVSDNTVLRAYATGTMCVLEGLREGVAIIRISNVSGTKSDELIVRVNKVDLTSYAYIYVLENLMWNKTIGEKQYLSIQIRGAKNESDEQQLLNALVANISNTGVLRISNDASKSRGNDNRWTWKIEIEAIAAGASELELKIPDTNALLNVYYPSLKGVVKKVYFKVGEGENIYSVDKSSITMLETSMGEMITATIDTGKSGGLKADQIQWDANDPAIIEIVQKIPPNNESGVSIVHVNALKAGKTWIDVKFGAAVTKIVYIDVAPIEYVKTDKSNISISPGKEEKFIIFSNPNNEEITFFADSNIGVDKIEGRPAGTEQAWSRLNKFVCGQNGYEVKISGGELEGTVRLTFTMEKTQKKTMVTVNNVKNYYIRWIGKSSLRFQPDEPETGDKVKIYYECNPADDWLEFNGGNSYDRYFSVICDESCVEDYTENGVTKPTRYIKLLRNQKDDKGNWYYASCSLDKNNTESGPLPFRTKKTDRQTELPVYIYYEKINVSWGKNAAYKPNSKSKFDEVTYAISLAPNAENELWIDLAVPDELQRNAITWVLEYQKPENITINLESTGKGKAAGFRISRNKMSNENYNSALVFPSAATYLGLLTVKYEYYNGNSNRTAFERKFLVYANTY